MMTDFIVKNKLSDPEDLKTFDRGGYEYAENKSNTEEWVFIR